MRNNARALHTVLSILVTLVLPPDCAISPQGYTLLGAVICVHQSLTRDARCVMLCSRPVFSECEWVNEDVEMTALEFVSTHGKLFLGSSAVNQK